MAAGKRSWIRCGPAVMRVKGSNGRSARTPLWSARTSTPLAPAGSPPLTCPRGALANDKNPGGGKAGREGLGRSRGGLSTKIHLAADRRCRPIARITTPGQHGDCPQFIPLMRAIRIGRRGTGRPRTRPGRAMADKAYSSAANRAYLRRHGIKAVIPVKEDQKSHRRARGRSGGRPPAFDPGHYRERSAASASSSNSGPWQPDTTSASASTRAPWMSPQSESGYKTRPMIQETRSRRGAWQIDGCAAGAAAEPARGKRRHRGPGPPSLRLGAHQPRAAAPFAGRPPARA
jgi:Transposase DDE domain